MEITPEEARTVMMLIYYAEMTGASTVQTDELRDRIRFELGL